MDHSTKPKKLRTACDVCHQAKMKCSGGRPCDGCRDSGYDCSYSVSNRIGRPKGTKNKRTLERLNRQNADHDAGHSPNIPSSHPVSMSRQSTSCLESSLSTTPTFSDDISIDAMLGTNSDISYPLSNDLGQIQFPDPVDVWCDLDGLGSIASTNGTTSPMKVPNTHQQSPFLKGDISLSPAFDAAGHFPGAVSQPSSYGAAAYMSPPGSSRRSSDRDTSITISSNLSRFDSTESGSSTASNTCRCLEHNAELFCRLKELEQRHIVPRIDVVLVSAQQALVPWKNVIECRICRDDDNQEVLLLSAMSIRSVLRRLQSLLMESRGQDPFSGSSSPATPFSQRMSPADKNGEIKSTIGIYEITGEERTAVTDLLVSRTLDRIRYTLMRFKERLDNLRNKKMMMPTTMRQAVSSYTYDEEGDGNDSLGGYGRGIEDLEHLEQVWRNLESTVQRLVRAIRSGTATPI
ncbi:MAG: hypothetical protein Q9217_005279 [Psora testacea]